jgi:hypothetical protein
VQGLGHQADLRFTKRFFLDIMTGDAGDALVGGMTPVIIEMLWVFPAPLGPSNPKISPSSTEKLMPLTAVKSPYFLTSSWTSRIGGIRFSSFMKSE